MPEIQTEPKLPISREPWTNRLMRDVAHFHVKTGMKYSTIGFKALGNARFWERLESGGNITLRKADDLYEWMAEQGFHFNS